MKNKTKSKPTDAVTLCKLDYQERRSQEAAPKAVDNGPTFTDEQQALSTRYLTMYPGKVTIGQRWEAINRLFVNRLGWAVHDQQFPNAVNETYGTDCWLENAIGETVVRAYALGMLHSVEGAKAESTGGGRLSGIKTSLVIAGLKNFLGEADDYRPSDMLIEMLHQVLRDALPMWNDMTIIDKVRAEHERKIKDSQAKRQNAVNGGKE